MFSVALPLVTEEIPFYSGNKTSFVFQFYPSIYLNLIKLACKT